MEGRIEPQVISACENERGGDNISGGKGRATEIRKLRRDSGVKKAKEESVSGKRKWSH